MTGQTLGPEAVRQMREIAKRVLGDAVNELGLEGGQAPRRQRVYFGKPQTAVTAGNTETFYIYSRGTGAAGAEVALDGRTIENVFCRNTAATADMHCLEWIDGGWHAFQVEC